jgi:hypothetical protein
MANTIIQIKRSLTNSQPTSLSVAELGYSYQSNTVFIGTPDGTGTIAIGGKRYLDLLNTSFNIANAAYDAANGAGSLAVINLLFNTANAGFDKANSANVLAYNTGIGANAYATAVGTAGNAYTYYYASLVGTSGNAYAVVVGNSGNAYAQAVGTSGNAYATAVGTAGNAYASLVGTNANNYSNATFLKLVANSQTITGDFSITGNLFIGGNTTSVSANNLVVNDPLIYLANGNPSDIIDIGFIGSYINGTSAHVHTGLFRDHASKQYYLFQGFDADPELHNDLTPYSNNMVNATLVADIITSNLTLGGANAIVWINSAYDNSNAAFGIGNAAFGHSNTTYAAVNSAFGAINASFDVANASYGQVNTLATSANAYAASVGVSANAYAVTVGTSGNAYAVVVGNSGNAYAAVVGASSNAWANTLNTAIFQTFSDAANISSGTLSTSRLSGSYTGITGLGTITTGTWHGSTINVGYGGTGIVSATLNGVLFGGGGNASFQVTSAGIEGQVLTASATGVPQFEMISGGTF